MFTVSGQHVHSKLKISTQRQLQPNHNPLHHIWLRPDESDTGSCVWHCGSVFASESTGICWAREKSSL